MRLKIFILLSLITVCAYIPINIANAATFTITGDVVGAKTFYTLQEKNDLSQIAREHDVGIIELLAANPGINPQKIKSGMQIVIPSMYILPEPIRSGIVINLAELRLFYYSTEGKVITFPIGIGRDGWETPTARTKILRKRKNPIWTPPESLRVEDPKLPQSIPSGPNNPLGYYALDLGVTGLLIHGTNKPYSVGKRSSHGCIRLYPEDIEQLFNMVEAGTTVTIIDNPIKFGWLDGKLYMEAMPSKQNYTPKNFHELITQKASDTKVNWQVINQAIQKRAGIPVIISE